MSLIEQALRQTKSEETRGHCMQLPAGIFCSGGNETTQNCIFISLAVLSVFLTTALFIGNSIRSHHINPLPSIKHITHKIAETTAGNKIDGTAVKNINSSNRQNHFLKNKERLSTDIPAQEKKEVLESGQKHLTVSSSSYLSVNSMNSAGLLYLEKGDYRQARLFFEEALKYAPDNCKFLSNMGLSFYLEGNNHKAEFFFKKALRINPKNIDTLVNLGIVYCRIKQYNKSTATFKKALSINQNSPELLYNYAILLEEINQQEKAVFYFYKFLETAPENLNTYIVNVKKHLSQIKNNE